MKATTILVAGGSGDLGGRIIKALLRKGADVRAIVRSSTDDAKVQKLEQLGVKVIRVNMLDVSALTQTCEGASCVISALQGMHDVIVDMQSILLDAATAAGVPRFIPSDFSCDFTKLLVGDNRNFDLRREFHECLKKVSIAATSIFNGAFADMLTGQMPLILFKLKRVLYWGNADQRMDFTTKDDTAAFTASAALDPSTPRFLRIAGDQLSARELTEVMNEVTGKKFRLFRAGGMRMLGTLIKVARMFDLGKKKPFPAWQGMQYMHNMFDGRAKLEPLDNERYPDIKWTSIKELLAASR
jgi:nucleoside-diphosphate-sugar epimerase